MQRRHPASIGTTMIALALLVLAGCGGEPALQEFSPPDGRFKAQMPGIPKLMEQSIAGMTLQIYITERTEGAILVLVADVPVANEPPAMIEMRFDSTRAGMMRNTRATLKSETKIALQGKFPGREIVADLPELNGVFRCRLYLVGNRLYQLQVIGKPSFTTSSNAEKFLNSFEVTP